MRIQNVNGALEKRAVILSAPREEPEKSGSQKQLGFWVRGT